jgi:hypothetical protein
MYRITSKAQRLLQLAADQASKGISASGAAEQTSFRIHVSNASSLIRFKVTSHIALSDSNASHVWQITIYIQNFTPRRSFQP